MSTQRDQVVTAIVAALNTGTPVGLPATVRSSYRQVELDPTKLPKFQDVRWVSDDEEPEGNDEHAVLQFHRVQIVVNSYALGTDATTPEQELDKFAAWIAKALNRNRLGGLVHSMRVRRSIMEDATRDRPTIRLRTGVLVKFTSRAKDAEQRT